jgi:hypothetical protein
MITKEALRDAQTPEAVERHRKLALKFADICHEVEDEDDVLFAAMRFFCTNFCMHFGEVRREHIQQLLLRRLRYEVHNDLQF